LSAEHVHICGVHDDADGCPFCIPDRSRVFAENDLAFAILDAYPVTPGHTLLIPKRHMVSFFEATAEERSALFELLDAIRERLLNRRHPFGDRNGSFVPDGFNIGINDGVAAGQSVMHLHIHVIPRYEGDCECPRGGVRWVFPERAVYWKPLGGCD
jgi:diadenosine tetraphosphate (Ap4A) HIT family hydrolase